MSRSPHPPGQVFSSWDPRQILHSNERCTLTAGVLLFTTGLALLFSRVHICKEQALWHSLAAAYKEHFTGPPDYMASQTFLLKRPSFLLFGDSLTERGFGLGGWAAGLAHYFQRRVDVVNRGFGGYNTRWALQVSKDVLDGHDATNTKLVTVFFGANDAARPTGPSNKQHVPVDEYKENLMKILADLRSRGLTQIILLTPPAVYDKGRKAWQVVKVGDDTAAGLELDRTLQYTQQYAQACIQAAKDSQLPVVDLYTSMQQAQGWGELYFDDGLHFTPAGNAFVLDRLLETIKASYPQIDPVDMPTHLPTWDKFADDPEGTLKSVEAARQQQG